MPDVIDRPDVDHKTHTGITKPMPVWVLIIFKDERKTKDELKVIVLKILPELGDLGFNKVWDNLVFRNASALKRGPKEVVEHYFELCKSWQLNVTMELT